MSYTNDWFDSKYVQVTMGELKGIPLKYLEVGAYEGKSTRWMLDNLLTNSQSTMTVIDYWDDCVNDKKADSYLTDMGSVYERFLKNVDDHKNKLRIIKDFSSAGLRRLFNENEKFDIIYIDACHRARNVLEDAVLAWPLLKIGGIMVFDDYQGGNSQSWNTLEVPKLGIDAFLQVFAGEYQIILFGYQVHIQKTVSMDSKIVSDNKNKQ